MMQFNFERTFSEFKLDYIIQLLTVSRHYYQSTKIKN